jgi:hypothetical protein
MPKLIIDKMKLDKRFTMTIAYAEKHDDPDILTQQDIQGLRDIHIEMGIASGRIVQKLIKEYLQKVYYDKKGKFYHLYKDFI